MKFISYAQNFEDVMLWRALKDVKNGLYIDIGAQDPIVDSVSLAFYQHGWRGIHVEPTKQYSQRLIAARPDESVLQVAIGCGIDALTFFEFEDTGLSTASAAVAQNHIERGYSAYLTTVHVLSMDALLEKAEGRDVHWLKIDVEGYECQVLESWSISVVRPWILVIESTEPLSQTKNHLSWEKYVIEKGYKFAYYDGLNRFYVSEQHLELISTFESPPNVFDGFVLSGFASNSFCEGIDYKAQQAEMKAQQAEMKAQQAEMKAQQAEMKAQQVETVCREQEIQLYAMQNSKSWRLTAPLRWGYRQATQLRNEGFQARRNALIKKILRKIDRKLAIRPLMRQRLVFWSRKLGLYPWAKSIYARCCSPSLMSTSNMRGNQFGSLDQSGQPELILAPPRVRKIYVELRRAIDCNKNRIN